MSMFNAINTSASGLTAERLRMDIISKNIANANTTRTANGTPYRRQVAIFKSKNTTDSFASHLKKFGVDLKAGQKENLGGVEISAIQDDDSPFKKVHDPGHPDADENGYVLMPNVDIITEMANMISATRAYEANVTALNATKSMALKALEIGK